MGFNNFTLFTFIWIIISLFTSVWVIRNMIQTKHLSDAMNNGEERNIYRRILAIRQYERELLLVYLKVLLMVIGVGAIIVPKPYFIETNLFLSVMIPMILSLACCVLMYHSHRIHSDHDEILHLTAKDIKAQGKRE